MSGSPLQFQEQHLFIAHPAGAPEDRFDRRVDRFDDAEAHRMIAVGRDALEVAEQEVAEALHLGQSLPPQRLDPSQQEVQHPSVFDAAVVGVPDPVRDQSVKAFVIVNEGATVTAEELIAWCRERLSAFKVPEIVEFRATFPRTSVGKIQKHLF